MAAMRSTRSERFPPTAPSVTAARHLADDLPAGCRDAARVVLSELASNAVRHARTPFEVTVRVGDVVWVGVRDSSRRQPRVLYASSEDISGRGLMLVSSLATRWGIDWRDGDKVVWAELPLEDSNRMAAAC
jgi:anti-sigma regulatory factor (Ser/Thr protein kinase)